MRSRSSPRSNSTSSHPRLSRPPMMGPALPLKLPPAGNRCASLHAHTYSLSRRRVAGCEPRDHSARPRRRRCRRRRWLHVWTWIVSRPVRLTASRYWTVPCPAHAGGYAAQGTTRLPGGRPQEESHKQARRGAAAIDSQIKKGGKRRAADTAHNCVSNF